MSLTETGRKSQKGLQQKVMKVKRGGGTKERRREGAERRTRGAAGQST